MREAHCAHVVCTVWFMLFSFWTPATFLELGQQPLRHGCVLEFPRSGHALRPLGLDLSPAGVSPDLPSGLTTQFTMCLALQTQVWRVQPGLAGR